MDQNKVRMMSFIFMVAALALVCFSLYFSFALSVELQNLTINMAVLFFIIGNTGLLYAILDKLDELGSDDN